MPYTSGRARTPAQSPRVAGDRARKPAKRSSRDCFVFVNTLAARDLCVSLTGRGHEDEVGASRKTGRGQHNLTSEV